MVFSFAFVLGTFFNPISIFVFVFCFESGGLAAPAPGSEHIVMGENQPRISWMRAVGGGWLLPSGVAISSQWHAAQSL